MSKPNVLLVICHDLGRHVGCYGVKTVHTPNIDGLAAGGVRFADNFCTAPQCSPSRSSMMTGRYPHANGMMGLAHGPFAWEMHSDERHIARVMRENGYDTVLSGVQHVTQKPQTLGFDEILVGKMTCDEVTGRFCKWLTKRGKTSKPFYAQVGYFEPHRSFDFGGTEPDDELGVWVPPYLKDGDETRIELAAMQGSIRKMDAAFGRILGQLERNDLAEDTLVIFTVDHGIPFPRAKCTLYDPGISTALIMRWPRGGISGGRTCDALVSNVDMVPTLLDLLDLERPANLQGVSFAPCLAGEPCKPRREIFAEKTFHTFYDPMRCIRTDRYKYIVNFHRGCRVEVPTDVQRGGTYRAMLGEIVGGRDDFELYDLGTDPNETKDLAGSDDLKDIEADLRRRLLAWMENTGDPLLEGPVTSPTYLRVRGQLQTGR
ncbi:MAG: hypothetical protein AMK75_03075 [Planctomycetes bacterium SM23_65]|nr:MAG: hypothetical protein AMK75_03075 [Planctomycetes bacterium SM23_65]